MKFIHAADIHLDSPLRGLSRYEGAPADEIRGATRRAFVNMVDLAIEEGVDFLLIAGDLYDGDWKDHSTGLFFVRQMGRLREAEVPVFIIHGNHDAASRMTKHLRLPGNVHVFDTKSPETKHDEELGLAVHGQSFATPAVTEDLSRHYPDAVADVLNIGMLHTAVDGREGHDKYAPCSVAELQSRDYDYWALGHVHQREQLSEEPCICFPGNLQGRHIRESGEKGVLVVTADDSQDISVEFRCLDVFRWEQCNIDLSGQEDWTGALDMAGDALNSCIERAGGTPLAVRFIASGPTTMHERLIARRAQWTDDLRAVANDIGGDQVWVEKTVIATAIPDGPAVAMTEGPLAVLEEVIETLAREPDSLPGIAESVETLRTKLPSGLRNAPGLADLLELKDQSALAAGVRALVLERLRGEEGQ